jgi:hypothetical protein
LDGPFEVSQILVYTLLFAFAFSYPQCMSNLGFCKSIYTIVNQKQFEKCQTIDFPSSSCCFILKRKPQGESWPDKVATLQVNSTYSATKSQRKILLNHLVVDYSPRFSEYLQLLLSLRPHYILLWY